jgi:hypothetical protein
MARDNTTNSGAWMGWIVFASVMLLMTGVFNVIEGLVALIDDQRVLVTPDRLIAVDLTGWGWTLLIFGAVMVAAGLGLLSMKTWARITAIVVVAVHAAVQIAWLGAYPLWSLLMIALDVVVLFALTARWPAAVEYLDPYDEVSESGLGQHSRVG